MQKIEIVTSDERLITPSRLFLVGHVLGKSNLVKLRRIRTIIDNLMLIAGHLSMHAHKLRLALGRNNGWIHTSLRLAAAF